MNPSLFLRGATPVASWPLLSIYVQNFLEFSLLKPLTEVSR